MARTTKEELENLVGKINILTGNPVRYRNKETGKANVGHYFIECEYGGCSFRRVLDIHGVCEKVLEGYSPKKTFYYELVAFHAGILAMRKGSNL